MNLRVVMFIRNVLMKNNLIKLVANNATVNFGKLCSELGSIAPGDAPVNYKLHHWELGSLGLQIE